MKIQTPAVLYSSMLGTLLLCVSLNCGAAVIFSDNFDSGASPVWLNESGAWSASGGVYAATQPNNFPNAFSSLPFNLTNFTVDVDINGVSDGGIWLRSAPAPGTAVGVQGVILVLKYNDFGEGVKVYWHIAPDGTTYGDALNLAIAPIASGSNPHVHVEVFGNTYAAFINGATNPITSLVTDAFTNGRVALYDFSSETFDNFVLQSPSAAGTTVSSETTPLVKVNWQSAFGTWYQVQVSSAKAASKWTAYGEPVPGTGAAMSALIDTSPEPKFVRVQALQ